MNKIASVSNTPKTRKKKALTKPDVYYQFVLWMSVFEGIRDPKTQEEFAKKFRVSPGTLSDWKKLPEFWDQVEKENKLWGNEKTINIMNKFYTHIMQEGDAPSVKLWLQYYRNWQEKLQANIESEDLKKLTEQISKITESWKKDDHTRDHESDGSGTAANGGGKVVSP